MVPSIDGIWITELDSADGGPRVAVKDLFDTAGVRTTYGSAVFAWYAFELRRTMERVAAARLFHYSLLYLALLFVAMALDPIL